MTILTWTDHDGSRVVREFPTGEGAGKLRRALERQGIEVHATYTRGPMQSSPIYTPGRYHRPDPAVWKHLRKAAP